MPTSTSGCRCGAVARCTATRQTARSIASFVFRRCIRRPARLAVPICVTCTSRPPRSDCPSASAPTSLVPADSFMHDRASRVGRRIGSRDSVVPVEFHHIDKSFGAVAALRDVSVSVTGGEAHAIVGENGAGKSTLLKILAGSVRPDRGELRVGGEVVALASPRDALARGIGLVHQEMLAFPNLSVTANIFAGRELTGRFGRLREAAMRDRARELLARLHLPVSPDAAVNALPVAYRQLLQVARALAFECRILALDEPTTSLTASEADHLFRIRDG